jgi:hypothetical protein
MLMGDGSQREKAEFDNGRPHLRVLGRARQDAQASLEDRRQAWSSTKIRFEAKNDEIVAVLNRKEMSRPIIYALG